MLGAFVVAAALRSGARTTDADLSAPLEQLAALATAAPDDPMPAYLAALALCRKAERKRPARATPPSISIPSSILLQAQ